MLFRTRSNATFIAVFVVIRVEILLFCPTTNTISVQIRQMSRQSELNCYQELPDFR